MNEPSTNSFFVVLLFILRCLVPLAILFGVSYLLRRMGLVAIETSEPKEEPMEKPTEYPGKAAASSRPKSATQPKKPRKVSPPRKKTAAKKPADKTKTGNTRSRSNDNA